MSYRGRPSRGCKRCIAKKVKCDETQPTCQRCARAATPCEYRDSFELVHRNQTEAAERTAKGKWRLRATKTAASENTSNTIGSLTSTHGSKPSTLVTAGSPILIGNQVPLRPALQQLAHARFVYDFVSAHAYETKTEGAFDALKRLFDTSPSDSPLHCAISAVSLVNFGGRFKSPEASHQGAKYYGKALTAFASAISGPKERLRTNEALLAIFLLGTYEMLTSSVFDGTYRTHQYGAVSLLSERCSDGTLQDGQRIRYLGIIYVQLIMTSMAEGALPPKFDPTWQIFPKGNPRGRLTELMHRATLLRHNLITPGPWQSSHGISDSPGYIPTQDEVLDRAFEVDAELEKWYHDTVIGLGWIIEADTVPIHPEKRPDWAKELFSLPGAPERMQVYKNTPSALAANLCRTTRVWLNTAILRYVSGRLLEPNISDEDTIRFESLKTAAAALLMSLVEDICLSIPCLFQMSSNGRSTDPATADEIHGFRGLLILWPLVAATITFTQESVQICDVKHRRAWLSCVLTFLRHSLGIAKAAAFQPDFIMLQPAPYPEVPNSNVMIPKAIAVSQ